MCLYLFYFSWSTSFFSFFSFSLHLLCLLPFLLLFFLLLLHLCTVMFFVFPYFSLYLLSVFFLFFLSFSHFLIVFCFPLCFYFCLSLNLGVDMSLSFSVYSQTLFTQCSCICAQSGGLQRPLEFLLFTQVCGKTLRPPQLLANSTRFLSFDYLIIKTHFSPTENIWFSLGLRIGQAGARFFFPGCKETYPTFKHKWNGFFEVEILKEFWRILESIKPKFAFIFLRLEVRLIK